jgi:hypothetical protein
MTTIRRVPERQTHPDPLSQYGQFLLRTWQSVRGCILLVFDMVWFEVPLSRSDRIQYGIRHGNAPYLELTLKDVTDIIRRVFVSFGLLSSITRAELKKLCLLGEDHR